MWISDEQAAFFHKHGYLAINEFWTEREIAAMRAELDRFKRVGLLRNVTTEGDGKTHSKDKVNLQLCPMADKSDFFRAMPFAPKVAEAVGRLIGDPVVLHLDQVFIKPAKHGAGTSWHQDNAYFGMKDPMMGTALWTAVHDATIANGTMRIIPDVMYEQYEHSRDPYSDHHIRCYPPEERAVPIELPAGGVIFFAYGTPHCTGPNNTDRERAGVALHFHNGDHAAQAGFPPEKRAYLTGPKATGGVNVYGVKIAGTWEAEIARVLGD